MNKILFKLIEGKGKFFLMRDVPKEPIEKDYQEHRGPGFNDFIKADSEYQKALKLCISEALKNGEIVNPEVLPVSFEDANRTSWYWYDENNINTRERILKDGDTFDLPIGWGFETFFPNGLMEGKSAIRLLPEKPVQKEESQDELFMAVGIIWNSVQTKGASWCIRESMKLFTIKRKES